MPDFGRIEKVDIRELFAGEATEFTPWMARSEILRQLGESLGLKLVSGRTEVRTGSKRADVVCQEVSDADRPIKVVIENQLERLDDDHLGKALVYAEQLQVGICIWVATDFRHDYQTFVNAQNAKDRRPVSFYCVRVSAFRVDGSNPVPSFEPVVLPDDNVRAELRAAPVSSADALDTRRRTVPKGQSKDLIRRFLDGLRDELRRRNYRTPSHGRRPDYIRFDIGHDPARFSVVRASDEVRVRLHLWGIGHRELFDKLRDDREAIDREIGEGIDWPNPSKSRSSIDVKRQSYVDDIAAWSEEFDWVHSKLELFEGVFIWRLEALERGDSIVGRTEPDSRVA